MLFLCPLLGFTSCPFRLFSGLDLQEPLPGIFNTPFHFLSLQVSPLPVPTEPLKPRPKKGLFEDVIVFLGQVDLKISFIVCAAV